MQTISRILKLKQFRFFNDYKCNNNHNPFARYNIIYGFNGCGKSTLADFFKLFETEKSFDSILGTFEVQLQTENGNNSKLIKKDDFSKVPKVKVFHQDYIKDTISRYNEGLDYIYTFGEDHDKHLQDINALKNTLEQLTGSENGEFIAGSEYSKLAKDYNKATLSLDGFRKRTATSIKEQCDFPTYSKTNFEKNYDALKDKKTYILSDEELTKCKTSLSSKRLDIIPDLSVPTLKSLLQKELLASLNELPSNTAIEDFKNNSELNNWAKTGLEIHVKHSHEVCQFCGGKLTEDRLSCLKAHFDNSYNILSHKIKEQLETFNTYIKTIESTKNLFPHESQFYEELQGEYLEQKRAAFKLCDGLIDNLKIIIDIFKEKQINLNSIIAAQKCEILIVDVVFDFNSFDTATELIKKHNEKTNLFDKTIEDAQKCLENHYLACATEEYEEYKKDSKDKETAFKDMASKVKQYKLEVQRLEALSANYTSAVDKINDDLLYFFSREDIRIEVSENGYKITRENSNGDLKLSRGEENALALIYFFNSLEDKDINIENTIIILDDPISSFDSTFYYHAMSYIRDRIIGAGQVFILTHKFVFYKDMTTRFPKDRPLNKYILKRTEGQPCIYNSDRFIDKYFDEYAYLFKTVYEFTKHPNSRDPHYWRLMPNVARRLIDGFLAFKVPNESDHIEENINFLEKNLDKPDKARAALIHKLLNNRSHNSKMLGAESELHFNNEDEVKKVLQSVLSFIETHDNSHYKCLVNIIEGKQS